MDQNWSTEKEKATRREKNNEEREREKIEVPTKSKGNGFTQAFGRVKLRKDHALLISSPILEHNNLELVSRRETNTEG